MSNWKESYAFSFRKPAIDKFLAFKELKTIAEELDKEIKNYRGDLCVIFIEKDENSVEIQLPEGKIIKAQFFPELNRIELRTDLNKFVMIEVQKELPDYRLTTGNLSRNRDEHKIFKDFDKEALEYGLSLLIHEIKQFKD